MKVIATEFPKVPAGRVKEVAPEPPIAPPESEKVVAEDKAPAGS